MSAPKASRPARDRQFASTLAHGLQLLRCFTPEAAVLSNRQLSELSGLSKPTVSRYTYTLIELGYLKVDPVSGKFQLGNAVLTLSYPLLANIALRQVVRSPMRELAERLGCSVSLCMRERLSMVYVETSRSRSLRAQRYSDIGMSHPIIATSNGRAYLAACSADERNTLFNQIRVKTPEHWERWGESALDMIQFWGGTGSAIRMANTGRTSRRSACRTGRRPAASSMYSTACSARSSSSPANWKTRSDPPCWR